MNSIITIILNIIKNKNNKGISLEFFFVVERIVIILKINL